MARGELGLAQGTLDTLVFSWWSKYFWTFVSLSMVFATVVAVTLSDWVAALTFLGLGIPATIAAIDMWYKWFRKKRRAY